MDQMCADFVLEEILAAESICTFFQPIISLKNGTIFAYEALVRGLHPDFPELIQPAQLFAQADRETLATEFDRLCRKKAMESFHHFRASTNAMMFMNINTANIGKESHDSPHIGAVARQMGFDPTEIGLELIESPSSNPDDLVEFVGRYRDSGFLIVIDDFGCEHSNLDRLIQIHPDIIKIDRSLVSGIEKDPYRQSIVKSIHSLAEMTGSLCLAEGVETLEEIRTCHQLGVDLYQGFGIARPRGDLDALQKETQTRIKELQQDVRYHSLNALKRKRRLTADIQVLGDWLLRQLSDNDPERMRSVFEEFIAMNNEIECIYLLDNNGIQTSPTILSPFLVIQSTHGVFGPAAPGANHCLKPYFSCFEALGVKRYFTDPYLSQASGNICRTLAVRLDGETRMQGILCIDFLEEPIRSPSYIRLQKATNHCTV